MKGQAIMTTIYNTNTTAAAWPFATFAVQVTSIEPTRTGDRITTASGETVLLPKNAYAIETARVQGVVTVLRDDDTDDTTTDNDEDCGSLLDVAYFGQDYFDAAQRNTEDEYIARIDQQRSAKGWH
jgi:hypothetical protein